MQAIADHPPSRKLVYFVLQQHEPATKTALVDETALGSRTVDRAIEDLRDAGLITSTTDPEDARRTLWKHTKVSE